MPKRYSRLILPLHLIIDVLLLNLSIQLAIFLFGIEIWPVGIFNQAIVLTIINFSWILSSLIGKIYSFHRYFSIAREILSYCSIIILQLLIASTAFYYWSDLSVLPLELLITLSVFAVLLVSWKAAFAVLIRIFRTQGYNSRRVAILGFGKMAEEFTTFFTLHPESGYKFLGFFGKEEREEVAGNFEALKAFALENELDEIFCLLPYVHYNQVEELIKFGAENKIRVKLLSDFRGFSNRKVRLEKFDNFPILRVSTNKLEDTSVVLFKRGFDIVFSLVAVMCLFPVYAITALITVLTSKGPVFFAQTRIGKKGKPFQIYKFRSMYVNSEPSGPALAKENDCRITPWGLLMRRTRLDEIPQFFNVLKGDMSVVGPRPERQFFIDQIVERAPSYRQLQEMKPGITSLGQIKYGYAENVDQMVERMKYDLLYIPNVSFFLDIKLIFMTVGTMIKANGR